MKLSTGAAAPRPLLIVLAAVLVLAAAVGVGAAYGDRLRYVTGEEELLPQMRGLFHLASDLTRRQPRPDPLAPVQHAGVNPYGVNTFLEQEVEPAKRELALAMIADAGFGWVRQEFPWEDIEIHAKGDFQDRRQEPYRSAWDKYDNIVDLAEQYGVEIIVRLSNPPEWSRAAGNKGGTLAPPDDYDDFGDFVEAVVRRYSGRVRYYQIWNEPNIYPEWGEAPVNPEQYTELLRVAYTRAKAVDSDVVIICGALAATIENELQGYGMSDFIFLQRMYGAGAAAYFDVFSMQGYGLWSGPYDRRMRPRVLNFSRPLYIRDVMERNGDGHKAIWISEMNWNALPSDHPAPPAYGRVTPEQQAEYVTLAYERAQEEWPWVGVVNLWYFKRATDSEVAQPMYYFRMVEPDFTPQPVYYAVRDLARSAPLLHPGRHQEDHWALRYSGEWRQSEAPAAQFAAVAGSATATVEAGWRGTDLSLRAAGPATVAVAIDDAEPWTLTLEEGFAEVPLSRGAPAADHSLRLTVLDGTLHLDGLVVQRHDSEARLVSSLGACVVGLALAGAARRRRGAGRVDLVDRVD